MTPFSTGVVGTVGGRWDLPEGNGTTFSAQLANILASRAYINLHTVQNGGGELRGNSSQVPPVPEPATWAMLLLGFRAIGLASGRRGGERSRDRLTSLREREKTQKIPALRLRNVTAVKLACTHLGNSNLRQSNWDV